MNAAFKLTIVTVKNWGRGLFPLYSNLTYVIVLSLPDIAMVRVNDHEIEITFVCHQSLDEIIQN